MFEPLQMAQDPNPFPNGSWVWAGFDEILAALLSMDPLRLAPEPQAAADYVRMLTDCAPLEDEAAALAGCSEPASMMADVDLFLMKLMEIPGKLAPRLKCMEMRLSMEEKLFTAAEYVEQKTSACKAVKEALGYKGPRPKPAEPPAGSPGAPGAVLFHARRGSAEHPIATKAPRCTATAWMLTVAESFAKF